MPLIPMAMPDGGDVVQDMFGSDVIESKRRKLTAQPVTSSACRKAWSVKGLTSPPPVAHLSHSSASTCSGAGRVLDVDQS